MLWVIIILVFIIGIVWYFYTHKTYYIQLEGTEWYLIPSEASNDPVTLEMGVKRKKRSIWYKNHCGGFYSYDVLTGKKIFLQAYENDIKVTMNENNACVSTRRIDNSTVLTADGYMYITGKKLEKDKTSQVVWSAGNKNQHWIIKPNSYI